MAFDVTALFAGPSGVARYVRELGVALERQGVVLVRFAIGRGGHAGVELDGVRRLRVPLRIVHRAWPLLRAPSIERLAPGCEMVHAPDLIPPPSKHPVVLTVHDLGALERPDLHPRRSIKIQRSQLEAARDRAAVVLSDSQATAEVLRARGVDAARIMVVPIGTTTFPTVDRSAVPDGPYLLAVGSLTPRKGLETLVEAFARASLSDGVRLVLAGPTGWRADSVLDAIERHGADGRVVPVGAVTDAQLAALYERCLAVCVPSLAEGFGLPIIEAGAAGAPVVASDLPVFHEVGGGIALFVSPGDVEAWAAALKQIVDDDELRRDSASRGRALAAGFTWERTAEITVSAYGRALEAA